MICPHCNQFVPDTNYRCPECRKILKEGLVPRDFIPKPRKKQGLNLTYFVLVVIVVGLAVMTYFMFQKEEGSGTDKDNTNTNTNIDKSVPPKSEANVNINNDNNNYNDKTAVDGETPEESDDPREDTDQESFDHQEQDRDESGISGTNEGEAEKKEEPEDPYAWVKKEPIRESILSHKPGEEIDIERLVERGKTTIFDFYSAYCGPCRRISPLLEKLDRRRDDIVVIKIDINRKGVRGIDWGSPVVQQYGLSSIPHFIIYNTSGSRTYEGRDAYQQVVRMLIKEGIR